jgi:hypothetical protein
MMTHEPAGAPIRQPTLEPPHQPTLPFEQSTPAMSSDEPSRVEMAPCEVWEALPRAMKTEVHRDCLRTMREVIGDAPQQLR